MGKKKNSGKRNNSRKNTDNKKSQNNRIPENNTEIMEPAEIPADEVIEMVTEPVPDSEVSAPEVQEPAAVEPVTEVTEPVAVEPVTEVSEPVAEEPVIEVSEPVAEEPVIEVSEPVAEEPVIEVSEPVAEEPVTEVQDPAPAVTALTAVPQTSSSSDQVREEHKQNVPKHKSPSGDRPVTRKFLAAVVIASLLLNAAVSAGIMALYSNSIKKDVAEVKKSVEELESDRSQDRLPDWGATPPGRDNYNDDRNGWGSDDSGQSGNDDSYGWYGGDSDDDQSQYDWDDDKDDDRDDSGQSDLQNSSKASIGIVISDNNGVYISNVTGNNANKAGFKEGDKIVSFDGTDISDSNSLISEVQKHKAGDEVTVIVERDGKELTIKTTLE